MRVYREASSRVGAGFTTPRKMSYCPDNRVINFRSRQPFECGRPRGPSCAILRRRRRCKYIYYDHPCRPGSAGKKGDFFFSPPLPIVFPFPRALASRGDVEIARLIYDYFGPRPRWVIYFLSFVFSPFFSFTLNSFTLKHVQAWFEGYAFFPDQIWEFTKCMKQ